MELLERTAFLQTLTEYAGEARGGDGRLVLVSGESGIGETALVEAFQSELADGAAGSGAAVTTWLRRGASGRCST